MMAKGNEAPLVAQFILELANANPMANYRFHVYADADAKLFLSSFLAANGVYEMVTIIENMPGENVSDWWNSKDMFVGFPMQAIADSAYLDALSLGLAVFVPYSETKLYQEIDKGYKWQTVSDLVSTIMQEEYTSSRSQELALQLSKVVA